MTRSWLFAPGHNEKLLGKVFDRGADEVILDLEDAVPPTDKARARELVVAALHQHRAWVRINAAGTSLAEEDLRAVSAAASGIRIPKAETVEDVRWVAERAPGKPIICAIESAKGVLNAFALASEPQVAHLALGGIDLRTDLGTGEGAVPLQYVRSHLVVASRAAGLAAPIDSVYPDLQNPDGLRSEAELSRVLGFGGKSAVHPNQLATLHSVFTPSEREVAWALEVTKAFTDANGEAIQLPGGEFVDLPVAERARKILLLAEHRG
ncbi:citrate lyase subunit beta/citryl-CoA lyase [Arthrobacter sp. 1088]|uniref:HpcH/HpaI aldolase/citrate lyase family protein n=1 Tax=Arthrobacter sp. 1088 TaxID=2817768 RepID=UPI0028666D3D|nr:CoA ester lyase [Arthrobacter sp. 1088]MDR6688644.1 citrate lyase subunit beta/citryl-CoA lyase [Arthrobacter sp. 1088]